MKSKETRHSNVKKMQEGYPTSIVYHSNTIMYLCMCAQFIFLQYFQYSIDVLCVVFNLLHHSIHLTRGFAAKATPIRFIVSKSNRMFKECGHVVHYSLRETSDVNRIARSS